MQESNNIQLELNTPTINIEFPDKPIINIELPGGARGLKGDKGNKGDVGATPQFGIGTVVDSDTATASITGTAENPELNLGLPRGKSGVWVGESYPDSDQYNVWIDPQNTPGTIPTKTSELTNDSGYVTVEEIGYAEHLTNKVFIDENNVRHPVYSKMFFLDYSNTEIIQEEGERGAAHGITNFGEVFDYSTFIHRPNNGYNYGQQYLRVTPQYIFCDLYDDSPVRIILEYIKSTQGGD